MSILDTLITDRTIEDVNRVRSLCKAGVGNMGGDASAFLNGSLKGAYNYTDLNRVETAVEYVANALVQAQTELENYAQEIGIAWDSQYSMPYSTTTYSNIVVKKNWALADIPNATAMARYYGNLVLLRDALNTVAELPASMNRLDYVGANQIERLFLMVMNDIEKTVNYKKTVINSTADVFRCGEIYSGEIGGDA